MASFPNNQHKSNLPTVQAVPVGVEAQGNVPVYVNASQQSRRTQQHIDRGIEFLLSHNWPRGLANSMLNDTKKMWKSFFIVDDSGSMNANDGTKIEITRSKGPVVVKCSRWAELVGAIDFHAEFAYTSQSPSEFRLLNAGTPIMIGEHDDGGETLQIFRGLLSGSAAGGTPLCHHIQQIAAQVQQMEGFLRQQNMHATLTIFTDGESSDGNVEQALKRLEHLPIWVTIRLCTDEPNVVNYWNAVDSHLELSMDVLDDLFGEAEEVGEHNNWLVYGEPLHRFREFGSHRKELDMLDEMSLSTEHLRLTLATLFGGKGADFPHPEAEFEEFAKYLEKDVLKGQQLVFNPQTRKMTQWIDMKNLARKYGKGGSCVVM